MSITATFRRAVSAGDAAGRDDPAAGAAGFGVVLPIECTRVDAIDSHPMCATDWNPLSPISAARSGWSINDSNAAARASAVGSTTKPFTPCFTKQRGSPESRHVTTGFRDL